LFGVSGEITELKSERDQIFKVSAGGEKQFVLRVSGYGDSQTFLESQNNVLLKIAREHPELPVPRICRSINGRSLEHVQEGGRTHGVRLFTFVSGEPIEGRVPSAELYRDIGRTLAILDQALKGFRQQSSSEVFLWNMQQLTSLSPMVVHIEAPIHRQLVEIVLESFAGHALEKLAGLRSQVIHNDFNPRNVLVESSSPHKVSGVIDFGDLVEGALIIDLGVAIARQVFMTETLASACDIVDGYHAILPLQDDEVSILFDVICARLALRGLIWSWRRSLHDPRFHPGRIGDTFDLLSRWMSLGEHQVADNFRAACGRRERYRSTQT
jgi:Ser/Thr protein kinase RdoA (MazF antagonist)